MTLLLETYCWMCWSGVKTMGFMYVPGVRQRVFVCWSMGQRQWVYMRPWVETGHFDLLDRDQRNGVYDEPWGSKTVSCDLLVWGQRQWGLYGSLGLETGCFDPLTWRSQILQCTRDQRQKRGVLIFWFTR